MRSSFYAVQAALGFGKGPKTRSFSLWPKYLARMRKHTMNNFVRTSKYSMLSFLPVNLFQQFAKAANLYFVFITILQTIKVISISNGEPTMLPPLLIVVMTSMAKDAYEDYCRHHEDSVENNAETHRFNIKMERFDKVSWGQI